VLVVAVLADQWRWAGGLGFGGIIDRFLGGCLL